MFYDKEVKLSFEYKDLIVKFNELLISETSGIAEGYDYYV